MYFSNKLKDIARNGIKRRIRLVECKEMMANPAKFDTLIANNDRSDTRGIPIHLKGRNIISKTRLRVFDQYSDVLNSEECQTKRFSMTQNVTTFFASQKAAIWCLREVKIRQTLLRSI